jgi:hypothetical protein
MASAALQAAMAPGARSLAGGGVVGRTAVVVLQGEAEVEAGVQRLEHGAGGRHHLLADAVAGQYRHRQRVHAATPARSVVAAPAGPPMRRRRAAAVRHE